MPVHVVREGDSLSAIAAEFGASLGDVLALNPQIANPDLIHPGQEINLPEPPSAETESATVAAIEATDGQPPADAAVEESATSETTPAAPAASGQPEPVLEGRLAE